MKSGLGSHLSKCKQGNKLLSLRQGGRTALSADFSTVGLESVQPLFFLTIYLNCLHVQATRNALHTADWNYYNNTICAILFTAFESRKSSTSACLAYMEWEIRCTFDLEVIYSWRRLNCTSLPATCIGYLTTTATFFVFFVMITALDTSKLCCILEECNWVCTHCYIIKQRTETTQIYWTLLDDCLQREQFPMLGQTWYRELSYFLESGMQP